MLARLSWVRHLLVVLVLLAVVSVSGAAEIRYIYDDLNRLIGVRKRMTGGRRPGGVGALLGEPAYAGRIPMRWSRSRSWSWTATIRASHASRPTLPPYAASQSSSQKQSTPWKPTSRSMSRPHQPATSKNHDLPSPVLPHSL